MKSRSRVLDEHGAAEIDILELAHDPNVYPRYALMRERAPVLYSPASESWRLTRHADIVFVLRDERFGFPASPAKYPQWRDFVDTQNIPGHKSDLPQTQLGRMLLLQSKVFEMRTLWILVLNPPSHTRLRALVQPFFGMAAVTRWQLLIQQTTDTLLDALIPQGEFDVLNDLTEPLILTVVMKMLGMPITDRPQFARWAHQLGHFLEEGLIGHNRLRVGMAGVALTEYFRKLIEARQAPYGDDVIGALIRDFHELKLNEDELLAMCILLSLGGYATTMNMMGNSLYALLQHQDQWELLQQHPELVASAVEECLRYDTPGQTAGRMAFTDVELDGVTIRKGEWVNLLLGAGNRDPAVFPDPDRFDITRSPNPHLGFGHGIHYCVGAHLARALARTLIETLARRLPQLALRDTAVVMATDVHLRGLETLFVRL